MKNKSKVWETYFSEITVYQFIVSQQIILGDVISKVCISNFSSLQIILIAFLIRVSTYRSYKYIYINKINYYCYCLTKVLPVSFK